MTREQRRLTAVVSADVVGYSRLMGEDESGTLAALKAHLHDLIEPKITEYGGRVVKRMGDGLLLDFPSVVDAVRCAVDVQRGMAQRNVSVPDERRILFRVGVNLGDIIIDGEDIFGDGVNVAARLQSLAEPGGICVSRAVRDQVLDKLSFAFEDIGAQQVKNIRRPIEVYRVLDAVAGHGASGQAVVADVPDRYKAARNRMLVAAAALCGAAIVVALAWLGYERVVDTNPHARPFRSLAVMPVEASSSNADDEQLARMLTLELSAAAGRALREGLVISGGRVQQYAAAGSDPRKAGSDLGVRYMAIGAMKARGEARELVLLLVDTLDGSQVWSGREPVVPEDAALAASRLAHAIRDAIVDVTRKEIGALPVKQREAWNLVLRALALPDTPVTNLLEIQRLCEEALRLDPAFVPAMLCLEWGLMFRAQTDPENRAALIRRFDEVSKAAVATAPGDPRVWVLRAYALQWQDNANGAFDASERALRLDPNRASSLLARAWIHLWSGRYLEALDWADRAEAMQEVAQSVRCIAYTGLARDADAASACEAAVADWDFWVLMGFAVGAYANLGDAQRAAAWKARLMDAYPDVTVERFATVLPSGDAKYRASVARAADGLRKAGVPER